MHAVTQTQPGRPVRLLRLWLVAAVLAGVALMHGLQCRDGMTTMTMVTGGIHLTMDSPTATTGPTVTMNDDDPAGLGGGLLGACLALLVGVLGAMLLDQHTTRRLVAAVRAAGPHLRLSARSRAPTLSQLCLLRT